MQEAELRRNVGGGGAIAGPAGYVYTVERLVEEIAEGCEGFESKWVGWIDR